MAVPDSVDCATDVPKPEPGEKVTEDVRGLNHTPATLGLDPGRGPLELPLLVSLLASLLVSGGLGGPLSGSLGGAGGGLGGGVPQNRNTKQGVSDRPGDLEYPPTSKIVPHRVGTS